MVHQAVLDQTERLLFIVLPFLDEPLRRLQITPECRVRLLVGRRGAGA